MAALDEDWNVGYNCWVRVEYDEDDPILLRKHGTRRIGYTQYETSMRTFESLEALFREQVLFKGKNATVTLIRKEYFD